MRLHINLSRALEDRLKNISWSEFKFEDLVKNINEKISPKKSGLEHYVGLEHLDSGSLHIRRFGDASNLVGDKLKGYKKDFIFAKRNAYLKRVAILDFDVVASAHSLILRAREENVHFEFLKFFLLSEYFWTRAIEISVGSLSPTINWKTLANERFMLPDIAFQKELSKLLNQLDEANEKAYFLEKSLRKLFHSVRERKLSNSKFERVKLGYILKDIEAGKSLNGINTPAENGEKGVLKISAVGANGFVPKENKLLNEQASFLENHQVRKGDILITRANTTELVGRVCLVNQDFPNLMLCDKTLRLKVISDFVNPYFLVEVLNGIDARAQIESFATGTGGAMKNITQPEIRSIKIPLPPLEQQNKLADEIGEIKKAMAESVEVQEKYKDLMNSILSKVF